MVNNLIRVAGMALAAVLLTACAYPDGIVRLRYAPDPNIERLATAQVVTVFRFADARGDEGDNNPLRVGGVYNGYGVRVQKFVTPAPWPEALVEHLTAGFAQRGVLAVAVSERTYAPGTPVSTPLVLAGEIRNFSTEGRNMFVPILAAHVSGIIRLYDEQGSLLVEKRVSARARPGAEMVPASQLLSLYENLLNEAVQHFVRQVVTDPDLTQRLVAAR